MLFWMVQKFQLDAVYSEISKPNGLVLWESLWEQRREGRGWRLVKYLLSREENPLGRALLGSWQE